MNPFQRIVAALQGAARSGQQFQSSILRNMAQGQQGLYNAVTRKPAPKPVARPQQRAAGPNLLNAEHVYGTLIAQNTADMQKYTPAFRAALQRTNPAVYQPGGFKGPMNAGGMYTYQDNGISLRSNAVDPYTVTHEALHSTYQNMKPAQRAQWFKTVASKANPSQKKAVDRMLDQPLYARQNQAAALGNTFGSDTEVHSYLPLFNQNNQNPALSAYYRRYFKNPQFDPNNYRGQNAISKGVGGYPSRTPFGQFDWWRD